MRASRLALPVLLYVALDFANPLVSGAVSFVGGTIEVVRADRFRVEEPSPPGPAETREPAPERAAALGPRPALLRSTRPSVPVAGCARSAIRRSPLVLGPASTADDH
jgi:hypothetical protein